MALQVFAQLKNDGDLAQEDHIIVGTSKDFKDFAETLTGAYLSNKRIKSSLSLASRFNEAAAYPLPVIRITKKEARALVDNLESYSTGKSTTKKAKAAYKLFSIVLAVF